MSLESTIVNIHDPEQLNRAVSSAYYNKKFNDATDLDIIFAHTNRVFEQQGSQEIKSSTWNTLGKAYQSLLHDWSRSSVKPKKIYKDEIQTALKSANTFLLAGQATAQREREFFNRRFARLMFEKLINNYHFRNPRFQDDFLNHHHNVLKLFELYYDAEYNNKPIQKMFEFGGTKENPSTTLTKTANSAYNMLQLYIQFKELNGIDRLELESKQYSASVRAARSPVYHMDYHNLKAHITLRKSIAEMELHQVQEDLLSFEDFQKRRTGDFVLIEQVQDSYKQISKPPNLGAFIQFLKDSM